MPGTTAIAAALTLLLAGPAVPAGPRLSAQQLDRTKKPSTGPTPAVRAPAVVQRTLPNGLRLWVSTQRELPVLSAVLLVRAGAALDGGTPGLAQMTAGLLDEGTSRRSSMEFANALEGIGAQLNVAATDERTAITLQTLTRHADSAFALLAEMTTRPAFHAEELERERKTRLQALRQQKDRATTIANLVFSRQVYGADHPYGRPVAGTIESVQQITRDDVTGFYQTYFRPNNAILVVVGDITPDDAVRRLGRAFASWTAKPVPAAAQAIPQRPASQPTAVYLVDKPGAAQSEIRVGHAGAARSTSPDYYALRVVEEALGGAFASRVNLNLREAKGYTYGAYARWQFERGPGPFVSGGGIFTAKTDSALAEFVKELKDVRDGRPLTPAETDFAKASLTRSYPRQLETNGNLADILANLAFFQLPETEITGFATKVAQVTPQQTAQVARKYIDPDNLVIVVVGDVAKIRPGIEALHLGPVRLLDADGNPVAN